MKRFWKKRAAVFVVVCAVISLLLIINGLRQNTVDSSYTEVKFVINRRNRYVFNSEKILTDDFLGLHRSNKFPERRTCPYLSLRKPQKHSIYSLNYTGLACVPHRPTNEACKEATSVYGERNRLPVQKCNELRKKPVCTLKFNEKSLEKTYSLICQWRMCFPYTAQVGEISDKYGRVTVWKYAPNSEELTNIIQRSVKHGFHFIFVRCGSLKQVLTIPHQLPPSIRGFRKEYINVNILLIDSVARPHFYRSMPKTINALRSIVYNENIEATVLDYELLQSVSQHTADNCRPLYSGVTSGVYHEFNSNWRAKIKPLGISILFGNYKKHGYHTIFQEEGCWYDRFGITLTNMKRSTPPKTRYEYAQRWSEVKKIWKGYNIDNFGLTHFTCEVLQKYGRTNDFDTPAQVCLNGNFITSYYMDHHLHYLNSVRNNHIPSLHYLHLETGHSSSGVRIRNDDLGLANYVTQVAQDPNTLTILLSDHGHTRTRYAQTVEGRFEAFDPLMFIILPEHVARILGKQQVKSLVENQHRLFTTLDVHKMLMAIPDAKKLASKDYKVNGLLSIIPSDRTCKNLPLTPMTRCKCEGSDQRIKDNSERHVWLAEFALGTLNNMIQKQYMESNKGKGGYGSCLRLRGISTKNNLEQQTNLELVTIMDILTESPLENEEEVFQVMVKMPLIPSEEKYDVTMVKYDRHSLYSRYAHCVDNGVHLNLCACTSKRKQQIGMKNKNLDDVIRGDIFGVKTEVERIDSKRCLLLLKRTHNFSISYEVANVCDELFDITVSGDTYNMLLSRMLPINVRSAPNTIHFLLSAIRYVINDSYINLRTSYTSVDFHKGIP